MGAKTVSPQGLKWFQDVRFGMFIHWGLYSLISRGEWVMHVEKIPVAEYEKLVPQFNPARFNADEWVSIAADAGQKYMVITSRHHDGFSMYDTALSDYKITNTPFKRDPLRELADACARRRDVKLGFYSSLLDWHHPAFRFRKESGLAWSDYIAFLHGQVRELCTQFGDLSAVWFDGDWPAQLLTEDNMHFLPGGSFEYQKLYEMIHSLQPDAVVVNNRHAEPIVGEDVQGFEQDLPGQNTAGFNAEKIFDLPLETCMTINDHWGVAVDDDNHKSTRHLIHTLVRGAAAGSNYLLNVGPTALGQILPVHAQRLHEMGDWLRLYGESVYGTRAGVIASTPDMVSTHREGADYVHILNDISDVVTLKNVPADVQRARLLRDGSEVKVDWTGGTPQRVGKDNTLRLTIPSNQRDPVDTVVKLTA